MLKQIKRIDYTFYTSAKSQHKVKRCLFLYIIVSNCPTIF